MALNRALVIDVGNSRIKYACFEQGVVGLHAAIQPDESKALHEITRFFKPDWILISGSGNVPEDVFGLEQNARVFRCTHASPLPIRSAYHEQSTPGIDRLANVCALAEMFGEQTALAVDMGTCVTFDLWQHASFSGGIIAPGLQMRLDAMHAFTASLPLVELREGAPLVGNNTASCMQSGALNGWKFEVLRTMEEFENNFPGISIVITGGDAKHFDLPLKNTIFADPLLTLKGLYQILDFNAR
ncbi:MAG: hypothetical protein RL226_905 [Bacteroidota bacterium]|jgi:type III pantothenate kinase